MKDTNNYDYLYRIGTNTLTIIVGLLFAQVPTQIVPILSKLTATSVPDESLRLVAMACCIFLTMLFALVGVLVTVAYAHGELQIPFRPAYLLVTVLLISLPLYFSVIAIGTAVDPIAKGEVFNLSLFRVGVIGLLVFFLAQWGYLTYIYLFDTPRKNKKRVITFQYYFSIAAFLVAGVVFTLILLLINNENLWLAVSIGALVGSLTYLIVAPILRVPVHRLVGE